MTLIKSCSAPALATTTAATDTIVGQEHLHWPTIKIDPAVGSPEAIPFGPHWQPSPGPWQPGLRAAHWAPPQQSHLALLLARVGLSFNLAASERVPAGHLGRQQVDKYKINEPI